MIRENRGDEAAENNAASFLCAIQALSVPESRLC